MTMQFSTEKEAVNLEQVVEVVQRALKKKGYSFSDTSFSSSECIQTTFTIPTFRWEDKSHNAIFDKVDGNVVEARKELAMKFMHYSRVRLGKRKALISHNERKTTVTLYRKISYKKQ